MSGHSLIGASSIERVWNCPGSVALIKQHKLESTASYAAAEGTTAHRIAEMHLIGEKTLDLQHGVLFVSDGHFVEVSEGMIEAVSEYVEYVETLRYNDCEVRVEVPIHLKEVDEDAWGTCDCLAYRDGTLMVIDYKHGSGKSVEVENNKQLMYYALGAIYELRKTNPTDVIRHVIIAIVQPRKRHADGAIRQWEVPRETLDAFERGLKETARRVRDGDTTLSVGSHCYFCPAKGVCPEYRQDLRNTANLDFADFSSGPVAPPQPGDLTIEQLAAVLDASEKFETWVKAVQEYAHVLAKRGVEIPGYKLVKKRANRRWKDMATAEKFTKIMYGEAVYEPQKLKSPAQMEKLFGKKNVDELVDLIETPDGGLTLAKCDDERPMITIESEFEGLT